MTRRPSLPSTAGTCTGTAQTSITGSIPSTTVPESFQGKPLWMHVCTQIDEWDDGKNPQFLLFVNGEIVQGIDMNHREVLLSPRQPRRGSRYRLELQAYTGTLHTEFNLIVEFRGDRPRDLEGLYWDSAGAPVRLSPGWRLRIARAGWPWNG